MKIIKYPNPILRKKAKAVKKVDGKVRRLIERMAEIMYASAGVGLAAPQVGQLVRVIVVDAGDGLISIINPKIRKKSGEQAFIEGCLSVPNLEAPVRRAAYIKVLGLNKNGEKMTVEAEGLKATVIQHEMDHLDGKLFIDRVEDPSLIRQVSQTEEKTKQQTCKEGGKEECKL
jgi:peptide deformylase